MADNSKRPIIIKKVKKVSGGGHHGGAWKVAYADFVTAMMAFFLLLWLVSQVPTEKLSSLADYFTPTAGLKGQVGNSGKGGQGREEDGILKDGGSTPNIVYGAPDNSGDIAKAAETNVETENEFEGSQFEDAPEFETPTDAKEKIEVAEKDAEKIEEALEKKRFDEIAENLKEQIEKSPELAAFADNLKIDQTEDGLRIQLTDLEGVSMFKSGDSELNIDTEPLLAKVSELLQSVDNKISIIGHTDSVPFNGKPNYSNWELSADRANASRRFLLDTGVDPKRLYKVEGMADSLHYNPENPEDPQNRRISIIIMKKSIAPVN
jgi:chemotaxis protein MotB